MLQDYEEDCFVTAWFDALQPKLAQHASSTDNL